MPEIRIANGGLFDPWKPEIKGIKDTPTWDWLGHHLANECRYAGGCKWFYSVAQHSVLASRYVIDKKYYNTIYDNELRLAALLHDATEAVLKDIPGPFKKMWAFEGYKSAENNLAEWIYKQFGLRPEYLNAPPIKTIDKELLDAERAVLFPDSEYIYSGSITVEPWDREYARDEFNRTLLRLAYP